MRARATATRSTAPAPQGTTLAAIAAPSAAAELPSNSTGGVTNEATHSSSVSLPIAASATTHHLPESEQRLSTSGADEDIGWETSKGKSRRKSKSCQQAAAPLSTQPNQYSLTQLKSDEGRWGAILSNSNSDEANSDETIPLNEDDWSSISAGSVEEQSVSAESSKVALRVSTPSRRKRGAAKAGAERLQTRAHKGSNALADQPTTRGRAANREELDLNATEATSTTKQYLNAASLLWRDAKRVAPKALQVFKLPATHLVVQSMLVALALVLLCFTERLLPPTLPKLDVLYWLEIPVGIALAFKLHELSGAIQAICAPFPAPSRARDNKD